MISSTRVSASSRDGLTAPALGLGHRFRVVVVVRQRLVDVGDVEVETSDRSRLEAPSVDPVADEPDGESPAGYVRLVVDVRLVTCDDPAGRPRHSATFGRAPLEPLARGAS